ncbi:uncharacterized protein LOC144773901 [Lissotriton helveticus]
MVIRKAETGEVLMEKTDGNYLAKKEKCYEYSEKVGKLLAIRIRQNLAAGEIKEIRNTDGVVVNKMEDIQEVFREFYEKLYDQKAEDTGKGCRDFLAGIPNERLDREERKKLDLPLTLQELKTAVYNLPGGKATGPDQIPAEFYKTFWDRLGVDMLETFRQAQMQKSAPQSWDDANIIVILKKDKPPLDPGSYRPIILLNADAKMYAKALAQRLSRVIEKLELSEIDHTDVKKRWKKSMIQKSMSENGAFERKNANTTFVQNSKKSEKDTYNRRHCHLEDLTEYEFPNGDTTHLFSGKTTAETPGQIPSYEQWIPPRVQSPVNNDLVTESEDGKSESMGTLKRLKKLVQAKKANGTSMDDAKNILISTNYPSQAQEEEEEEEETLTTCMKLTKSQEKRPLKEITVRKPEPGRSVEYSSASLDRLRHSRWSSPVEVSLHSDPRLWSDWKPFPDTDLFPFDVALPKMGAWENCTCCNHHPWLPYSFTDIDLAYAWVSDFHFYSNIKCTFDLFNTAKFKL